MKFGEEFRTSLVMFRACPATSRVVFNIRRSSSAEELDEVTRVFVKVVDDAAEGFGR
jgi:hypothetical protein